MQTILNYLKLLLYPLSWIYLAVVKTRNYLYDKQVFKKKSFDIPIISVGNISTGGTGKTPMSAYLIEYFEEKGMKTAYLSRGYGRKSSGYKRVHPETSTFLEVGDEALQIACTYPNAFVAVCENRSLGVEKIISEQKVDLIILDDAFQHRSIDRNVDIVMIDANNPPWKDKIFPVGNLREPAINLKRADLLIVNKTKDEDILKKTKKFLKKKPFCYAHFKPQYIVALNNPTEQLPLSQFSRKPCLVFCGTANNRYFYEIAKQADMNPVYFYQFKDHHKYSSRHIFKILNKFKKLSSKHIFTDSPIILTTHKDAVRIMKEEWFIENFHKYPIYYLAIKIEISDGKETLLKTLKPFIKENATA